MMSVRVNVTSIVHQDYEPDDGVDYDADDEMDVDDAGYIGDDDANNSYGIQYVVFQQWILTFCLANIYGLKVNNRSTRKRREICSKLTIKTPEWHQWHQPGVFIVNFEHISHHFLVFLLLILSMYLFAVQDLYWVSIFQEVMDCRVFAKYIVMFNGIKTVAGKRCFSNNQWPVHFRTVYFENLHT